MEESSFQYDTMYSSILLNFTNGYMNLSTTLILKDCQQNNYIIITAAVNDPPSSNDSHSFEAVVKVEL